MLGATPREFESRILRHAGQPERAADRYRRPRVVVPATVGRYGPTGRLRRSAAASPRTDAGSARPQRDPGSRTTTRDIGRRCHGGRSTHSPARARNLRHRSARPRQSTPRRPLRRSRYEQHGSCSRCGAGQGTSEVVPGCRTRWCGRPCRPGVRVGRVPVMASEAVGRRCAPVCSCVGEARPGDGCRVRQQWAPERPVTGSRPRCRRGSPGRPGGAGPRSRQAPSRRTPRR